MDWASCTLRKGQEDLNAGHDSLASWRACIAVRLFSLLFVCLSCSSTFVLVLVLVSVSVSGLELERVSGEAGVVPVLWSKFMVMAYGHPDADAVCALLMMLDSC